MAETFVLSFVDKLILLEQKTASRVHYRIVPPLSGRLDDCIAVQKVAKQIADSIDLSQFTFIITFAKQKKNIGGHIDLSTRSREVFIEIDPDALSFPRFSRGNTVSRDMSQMASSDRNFVSNRNGQ
jgi:hypothetical protein